MNSWYIGFSTICRYVDIYLYFNVDINIINKIFLNKYTVVALHSRAFDMVDFDISCI